MRSEGAEPAFIIWSTGFPHEAVLPASAGGEWHLRVSAAPRLDGYSWLVKHSEHLISRGGQSSSAQFARAHAEAAAFQLDADVRLPRQVE